MRLGKIHKIHFVGIGGIGMSGIAEVLLNQGYQVSGSDRNLSEITAHLEALGAVIREGHAAENVHNADVVVYSSAVTPDNPEVQEAYRQKIPVIKRAEMLAELMRLKYGIAIAGTHGKTTTTAFTGSVLTEGKLDPTLIIGGKVRSLKTNAKLGEGQFLVAEADEFDRSFLKLVPTLAVITNIETDHLDCYRDIEDLQQAFTTFANKVPFYGKVIACLDSPRVQEILQAIQRKVETYGLSHQADLQAVNINYREGAGQFDVVYRGGKLGNISLQIPGKHNVMNALASISVGLELELPFSVIKAGLEKFSGVSRRFEIKAVVNDMIIVDDYAHHPTEIKATLQAARSGWPGRRILAVFQPHLFTRTRDFHQEFARSFYDAHCLFITNVYPSREKPIEGITGKLIADEAVEFGHKAVRYIADRTELAAAVMAEMKPGDLVITLGAGDIWKTNQEIRETLRGRAVLNQEEFIKL